MSSNPSTPPPPPPPPSLQHSKYIESCVCVCACVRVCVCVCAGALPGEESPVCVPGQAEEFPGSSKGENLEPAVYYDNDLLDFFIQ